MCRLTPLLLLMLGCGDPEPPPTPGPLGAPAGMDELAWGEHLYQTRGCIACHRIDGGESIGPPLDGLAGQPRTLADGETVVVDADYLRAAIADPDAASVAGYESGVMPSYQLRPPEMEALIAYLQTLSVRPR